MRGLRMIFGVPPEGSPGDYKASPCGLLAARLVCCACLWAGGAWAAPPAVDPLNSPRWEDMHQIVLNRAPMVFDANVKVIAPAEAENPMQVPLTVDASALPDVREVVVFADFNPVTEVLRFYPAATPAWLDFRAKLQQSSPVRAAARTGDGVWHVGGAWVNTGGGGCTAPTAGSASSNWRENLNRIEARQWPDAAAGARLRIRIAHPMDTGLVANLPAFYLEDIVLRDSAGRELMRIAPREPVSENPVFTLRGQNVAGMLSVDGRDTGGNRFKEQLAP